MNRTDKILNSLDGMQKVTASPFFYTRLSGKMQNTLPEKQVLVLQPAFLTAALLVVLLLNVATLIHFNKPAKQADNATAVGAFANEYDLTTHSIYQ